MSLPMYFQYPCGSVEELGDDHWSMQGEGATAGEVEARHVEECEVCHWAYKPGSV